MDMHAFSSEVDSDEEKKESMLMESDIFGAPPSSIVLLFIPNGFVHRPAHGLHVNCPQHSLLLPHYNKLREVSGKELV